MSSTQPSVFSSNNNPPSSSLFSLRAWLFMNHILANHLHHTHPKILVELFPFRLPLNHNNNKKLKKKKKKTKIFAPTVKQFIVNFLVVQFGIDKFRYPEVNGLLCSTNAMTVRKEDLGPKTWQRILTAIYLISGILSISITVPNKLYVPISSHLMPLYSFITLPHRTLNVPCTIFLCLANRLYCCCNTYFMFQENQHQSHS